MKKLCLLVLSVLFVIPVFAQLEKGYIYLKNGTVLKGKYKYSSDLSKVQVISEGNMWIFYANNVDSIRGLHSHGMKSLSVEDTNSPFYLRTEIGVLVGSSEDSQNAPFCFSSSINYQFHPLFSFGLGAGLEFLKESYMPLYVNLEFKWRDANSTPYFFLKSGYMVPLEKPNEIYYYNYQPWSSVWPTPSEKLDAKGGLMINPGIGYQRMFSYSFGMSFAFGYQFHTLHYMGEYDYGLNIDYNRLTIKLGIIFK